MVQSCQDLIFHLIPTENDILKNKITDKFGTMNFTNEFRKISSKQYARLISNQFANSSMNDITIKCVKEIQKISNDNLAEYIAINLDYDNLRHYLYFREQLIETFKNTDISTTLYLNKIIYLRERDDIDKIMDLYHKSILGGHNGGKRMYKTISKFYKWNNMLEDIKKYVSDCLICKKIKTTTNIKTPYFINSTGQCLFDVVYIDYVGPIAPSKKNNRYCFSATCDLTKYLVVVPTKDCTAITTAKCLLENIILRYNFPSRLVSDNAQSFLSKVIKELTRLCNIKKIFCTQFKPAGNLVERQHRGLSSFLRQFTATSRDEWDEQVKYATFVYNNTVHTTTGYTPFELAHGFRLQIPSHLTKEKPSNDYDSLAGMIRNNIAKSLKLARENLMIKKHQNKIRYDKNAKDCEMKEGDMILIKNHVKNHKFDYVWNGPYKIIKAWDKYVEINRKGKHVKISKDHTKKIDKN